MIILENVMTRDIPLVMVEAWARCFGDHVRTTYGITFPDPVFIYRGGGIESWRPTEAYTTTLPKEVSQWIITPEHRQQFFQLLDDYSMIRKELNGKTSIHAMTSIQAFNEIQDCNELFVRGALGLIISYWITVWNERSIELGGKALVDHEVMSACAAIRSDDALMDTAGALIYHYLEMIAANELWPKNLMKFLLVDELERALERGIGLDEKELIQRKQGYAYMHHQVYRLEQLPAVLKDVGYEPAQSAPDLQSMIRGTSAYKGIARGEVRIITHREQLDSVHDGNILVAPMTTPWYLPAMKKAAAFVTDEGGMLCHAAIVARELKKPCIIGTKIATKVLKDGDRVEVDADKGVIRVLKKRV